MKKSTKGRLAKSGVLLAATVALVGAFEGLRTKAYLDIVNVPTVCYGETRGVKMGQSYTVAQCQQMLGKGIIEFAHGVDKCLTFYVPDESYTAFVSLAYNVGIGAFCKSTLVKKANRGDVVGACNELSKWDRAGGKKVRGLTRRRAEERALCLKGAAR